MSINLRAVAVAGLAAVALARCDGDAPTREFRDSSTEAAAVSEVRVSLGAGNVTVRPGEDGRAEIARTVRYQGPPPTGRYHRVEGAVLHLATACGDNCNISYVVTVPQGVRVSGRNDAGNIDASGVSTVDLWTGSGGVTVTDATGPVSVRTDSGNVRLVLAEPADVRAFTGSGLIEVTVPAAGYQVETRTGSGTVDVGVPDTATAAHRLELRTDSGNITARVAP